MKHLLNQSEMLECFMVTKVMVTKAQRQATYQTLRGPGGH